MKDFIRQRLNEELSSKDKSEVKKIQKSYISSDEFKSKIEKIVKDRVKNEKGIQDKIVDITENVITQLYKTLWSKRSMWQGQLKNKAN